MHLVLFFTCRVSLAEWDQVGMLTREIAIYQALGKRGVQVSFVTYGRTQEQQYIARLPNINILYNRWNLPIRLYKYFLLILHAPTLARANVIKTNQMYGAEVALRAARLYRKPLVARCGYLPSLNLTSEFGSGSAQAQTVHAAENRVFGAAQRVVVTTQTMADNITARIPGIDTKLHIIPNYVDTEIFHPNNVTPRVDLIYIGRLAQEKQLDLLLEALAPTTLTLDLIGSGPEEDALRARFGDLDGRVRWLGNIPNEMLPDYLNHARAFVLPSRYEGHPKTPIEAMACGLPVVGTDVRGIREVITHEQDGLLCEPAVESLRAALLRLVEDADLRARLGAAARESALARYSLDRVTSLELNMLRDLVAG